MDFLLRNITYFVLPIYFFYFQPSNVFCGQIDTLTDFTHAFDQLLNVVHYEVCDLTHFLFMAACIQYYTDVRFLHLWPKCFCAATQHYMLQLSCTLTSCLCFLYCVLGLDYGLKLGFFFFSVHLMLEKPTIRSQRFLMMSALIAVISYDFNTKKKTHLAGILSCGQTKCQIPAGPAAAEPRLQLQRFLQCSGHLEENVT